jgi:SAM-dependent methyltransferase
MTPTPLESLPKSIPSSYYGDDFYNSQMDGSYRSAKRYVDFLTSLYKPLSVVDIGCGRGTWLKAFKDNGTDIVVGFDGVWNNKNNMIDQSILYYSVDLNKPLTETHKEKYDLAISLEVAEHLEESSAKTLIESITSLADVVMFGAAYTKQGGTNHLNEQPHTYWAKIFEEYGYLPYDLFRPLFWGDAEIEFWYQQNTFLYVKNNTILIQTLSKAGYHPMQNIAFMDCIHPILYNSKTNIKLIIKKIIISATPNLLLPLARVLKKYLYKK